MISATKIALDHTRSDFALLEWRSQKVFFEKFPIIYNSWNSGFCELRSRPRGERLFPANLGFVVSQSIILFMEPDQPDLSNAWLIDVFELKSRFEK